MITRSEAIAVVRKVHQTLARQTDLSPRNEIVTETLTHFIAFLQAAFHEVWAEELPEEPELEEAALHLPRLCGLAEVEMEKWWCRRFLAEPGLTHAFLKTFWYFENYVYLVRAERSLLSCEPDGRGVLLGSGALPLTAILLTNLAPGLSVHCVDRDGEACDLAASLIRALGMRSRIEVINEEAEAYSFSPRDIVVCASLLYAPTLFEIFIRKQVQTFILRDVAGLFRFCYRKSKSPPPPYRLVGQTSASVHAVNISRLHRMV